MECEAFFNQAFDLGCVNLVGPAHFVAKSKQQRGDTAHARACNSDQVDVLWRWRSERLAQFGGCHLTPSLTARSMTSATFFAADSGVSFFAAAAIVARRVGSFKRFEIVAAKTSGTISFSSTITDAPALR